MDGTELPDLSAADPRRQQPPGPQPLLTTHQPRPPVRRHARCTSEAADSPQRRLHCAAMPTVTATRTRQQHADDYETVHQRLDEIASTHNGAPAVPTGTAARVSKLLTKLQRSGLTAPEEMYATNDGGVVLCWHDEDITIMVTGNGRASISVCGVASNDDAAVDTVTVCGTLLGRPLHQRTPRR